LCSPGSRRNSRTPWPTRCGRAHPPSQCIGASSGGGSCRSSPISSNAWIDMGGAHDMSPTTGSGFSTMGRVCAWDRHAPQTPASTSSARDLSITRKDTSPARWLQSQKLRWPPSVGEPARGSRIGVRSCVNRGGTVPSSRLAAADSFPGDRRGGPDPRGRVRRRAAAVDRRGRRAGARDESGRTPEPAPPPGAIARRGGWRIDSRGGRGAHRALPPRGELRMRDARNYVPHIPQPLNRRTAVVRRRYWWSASSPSTGRPPAPDGAPVVGKPGPYWNVRIWEHGGQSWKMVAWFNHAAPRP